MAAYAVQLARTASTTASVGSINSNATRPRRARVYDIMMGSEGTPADNAFKYLVQRCTAAGTSTAVTPQPLDPADFATETTAGQNHTIEPTYTANAVLLAISVNQRATFRWVASPGGELVYPATASNGVGFQTPTSSAVAVTMTVHFQEL